MPRNISLYTLQPGTDISTALSTPIFHAVHKIHMDVYQQTPAPTSKIFQTNLFSPHESHTEHHFQEVDYKSYPSFSMWVDIMSR